MKDFNYPPNVVKSLAVASRRSLVRADFLRGQRSGVELARKYGVSRATIVKDLKAIRREFRKEYRKQGSKDLAVTLAELRDLRVLAHEAFQESRQDEEELVIDRQRQTCGSCGGRGVEAEDESRWCEKCEGNGWVWDEKEKRRRKGQAGDSSFLQLVLAAIREESRILGRYPNRQDAVREQQEDAKVINQQWNVNIAMTPDRVIDVRRKVLELEQILEGKGGNGEVIDVESSDKEDEQ